MAQTTFSGPVVSTNGFDGVVGGTAPNEGTFTELDAVTVTVSGDSTLSGTANVIVIPTSDPGVAGAIWNNAGTLSVSTGA